MMKNKATLKFKNFNARPRSFWIRTKLTQAGVTLCYSRPAEAVCLERSSAVTKLSGVGKNLKSRNFKSRNATSTNCEAGRYIDFSADYNASRDMRLNIDRDIIFNVYHDINSGRDRAANFKISNANLKAGLARPKVGFR